MATRLKVAIVENDLNQSKLAAMVGISNTAMSSIVRGQSEPGVRVALKIARALNRTVEELWGHLLEEDE